MRGEERAFLERSIADLEAEHAAGDLTDDDLEELRARYEARLAALDARRGAPPASRVDRATPPAGRRGMVVASAAFVVLVAVGAGVLVARSAGRREAGEAITGEVPGGGATTPSIDPELAACRGLEPAAAIDCYQGYTDARPDDPDGWTEFALFAIQNGIAGGDDELIGAGEAFLGRALELDPDDVVARVYLAVVLERTGRLDEAAAELERLEGVPLPADLVPLVEMVRAGVAAR